eukprot:4923890-Prymnesium_polylepis.1
MGVATSGTLGLCTLKHVPSALLDEHDQAERRRRAALAQLAVGYLNKLGPAAQVDRLLLDILARDRDRLDRLVDAARADSRHLDARALARAGGDRTRERPATGGQRRGWLEGASERARDERRSPHRQGHARHAPRAAGKRSSGEGRAHLASVSLPTLRLRPSRALPTEGRRARLLMMSWTAES